jgi:SH3 domain-containing YSC84-like protein 1
VVEHCFLSTRRPLEMRDKGLTRWNTSCTLPRRFSPLLEGPVMQTRLQLVVLLALVSPLAAVRSAFGQAAPMAMPSRETVVVDSATEVLGQIMSIPGRSIPGSLLAKAEGIVIIPGMIKGGFIVGVRHGRGVIVTRDRAGVWQPPTFVEITGASIGWQAGIEGTDLVLVFRTKNSLQNLMRGKFTIGANASAAAGPVGREAQAATDAALKAEIYSYSRSRGLFAGVALDGASLSVDQAATNAYYQPVVGNVNRPGQPVPLPASAGRLLEEVAKYTTTTVATPGGAAPAVAAPPGPAPVAAAPAPVDPQVLRGQLAASSRQLATVLDASWRTYLALPGEVYAGNRPPSAEALRASLDRFAAVAADPRYQTLTQRAEFRATWSLLSQYSATVPPPATQPLSLPPPPR